MSNKVSSVLVVVLVSILMGKTVSAEVFAQKKSSGDTTTTRQPLQPQVKPSSTVKSSSTKPEEKEERSLLKKLEEALLSTRAANSRGNSVLGGVVLRLSEGVDYSEDEERSAYFARVEDITSGRVFLTPSGSLYFLPGNEDQDRIVFVPVEPIATTRIVSITDSGEKQEFVRNHSHLKLFIRVPKSQQPIHLFQSRHNHLVLMISSSEFPNSSNSLQSALVPHQKLTPQEYDLLWNLLHQNRFESRTICQWLYEEKIVEYNKYCSIGILGASSLPVDLSESVQEIP